MGAVFYTFWNNFFIINDIVLKVMTPAKIRKQAHFYALKITGNRQRVVIPAKDSQFTSRTLKVDYVWPRTKKEQSENFTAGIVHFPSGNAAFKSPSTVCGWASITLAVGENVR